MMEEGPLPPVPRPRLSKAAQSVAAVSQASEGESALYGAYYWPSLWWEGASEDWIGEGAVMLYIRNYWNIRRVSQRCFRALRLADRINPIIKGELWAFETWDVKRLEKFGALLSINMEQLKHGDFENPIKFYSALAKYVDILNTLTGMLTLLSQSNHVFQILQVHRVRECWVFPRLLLLGASIILVSFGVETYGTFSHSFWKAHARKCIPRTRP